ncbi:membrane or secreted protein [Rubripirellula reticaptiva]|uniref:Membrane or secreted protein n=1 Tax=Rubripirellula reticaptiva TaxID=2528013 RepID=A0A5C6F4N1_9BACT|nr:membrane or secreted protein [Rubripirellula reticaptiva]TWU56155.1 hypothetical protein Poly59_24590 [Rubripirellula reticaptiva]
MSCCRFAPLLGLVLSAIFVAAIGGCRGNNFLAPPGSMNQQQANAIAHDPFPQSGIAPDDMASRPPDYQQPLPEAVRNRLVPDAMPWLGR